MKKCVAWGLVAHEWLLVANVCGANWGSVYGICSVWMDRKYGELESAKKKIMKAEFLLINEYMNLYQTNCVFVDAAEVKQQ